MRKYLWILAEWDAVLAEISLRDNWNFRYEYYTEAGHPFDLPDGLGGALGSLGFFLGP